MRELSQVLKYYNENVNGPRGGVEFRGPIGGNTDLLSFKIPPEHRGSLFDKNASLRHLVIGDYRDYNGQKVPDYLWEFSEVLKEMVKNRLGLETDEFLHPLVGYPLFQGGRVVILPLLSREPLILDEGKSYNYYELMPPDLSLDNFRLLLGGISGYKVVRIGTIYIPAPVNMMLQPIRSILTSNNKTPIELPLNVILPEGWAVYDNMGYHFRASKGGIVIHDVPGDRMWVLDRRIKGTPMTILLNNGVKMGERMCVIMGEGMCIIKNNINGAISAQYQEDPY